MYNKSLNEENEELIGRGKFARKKVKNMIQKPKKSLTIIYKINSKISELCITAEH